MRRPVSEGTREVLLAGRRWSYELLRSSRRTLAITVEPGGALSVTAPLNVSVERIEEVMNRRRRWILRRTSTAAALPPPSAAKEWVTGETHRYLGRQYRLKVSSGNGTSVRLVGRYLAVTVPDRTDRLAVRREVEIWYRERARATFERRLPVLLTQAAQLRLGVLPPITVRKLAKRWGSCSPDGRLLMNVDVVKLPLGCIDYLLIHELCHVRIPNHGPRFWRLLDRCMPEWERWRERLDEVEV